MNYQNSITLEAGKRGGCPCVRNLRSALTHLMAGMSRPKLSEGNIRACLAFAVHRKRRHWTAA
ncbi:MAG: DUF433 domain-containing protein [Verrucomicrobiota bacterium]